MNTKSHEFQFKQIAFMSKKAILTLIFVFSSIYIFCQIKPGPPPPLPLCDLLGALPGPNWQYSPSVAINLDTAIQGVQYNTLLRIFVPTDTIIPIDSLTTISGFTMNGIMGLPPDFYYNLSEVGSSIPDTVPGGTSICIEIFSYQVSSPSGIYPLTLDFTIITPNGSFSNLISGYQIVIEGNPLNTCMPMLAGPSQYAVPDTITNLPTATLTTDYATVIELYVPADSSAAGIPFSISDYTITGITGLPPDVYYTINPASGIIPGGTSACIYIFGYNIHSAVGTYPLTIEATTNTSIGALPTNLLGYDIVIQGPGPNCTATISANGTLNFCTGDSLVFIASAGVNYWWSTGDTSQSIAVTAGNSYLVTVTDTNNCTATSIVKTVYVYSNPTVSITNLPDSIGINDSPISLSGSSSGGVFSGVGVTGNTFSPAISGLGLFDITYCRTSGQGCTGCTTDSIMVVLVTNTSDPNKESNIQIYPNPASKHITIALESFEALKKEKIQILNAFGQSIYRTPITQKQHRIALEGFAAGLYHIQLLNAEGAVLQTKQVVME